MTDIDAARVSAVAPAAGDAAARASQRSRALLDAAVARAIAALAHDLRNALGVVSMQVEAIAARTGAAVPDVRAIAGHASVAADHIERLAAMTNALIDFARGRASSDLAVIVEEAAALAPLRNVSVTAPPSAPAGLDPLLLRTVVLELLILALQAPSAVAIRVTSEASGATVEVATAATPLPDATLEWVVQFTSLGGRIEHIVDGIRLRFPPTA